TDEQRSQGAGSAAQPWPKFCRGALGALSRAGAMPWGAAPVPTAQPPAVGTTAASARSSQPTSVVADWPVRSTTWIRRGPGQGWGGTATGERARARWWGRPPRRRRDRTRRAYEGARGMMAAPRGPRAGRRPTNRSRQTDKNRRDGQFHLRWLLLRDTSSLWSS